MAAPSSRAASSRCWRSAAPCCWRRACSSWTSRPRGSRRSSSSRSRWPCGELSGEDAIAVLLIEQNLGVAIDVADRIGVMVNGRIAQELPASELGADRALQERLLGVRAGSDEESATAAATPADDAPEGRPARPHGASRPRRRRALARRAGAARGARLQPLERRRHRGAGGRHRPRRRSPRRAASRRVSPIKGPAQVLDFPVAATAAAPPTSSAPSTPRDASSTSCASASRSSACASSPSTSRPRASRRPRRSIRARSRAIIPTARRRSSPAIAAAPSRRWRSPSRASFSRAATSAGCSRPADRAAPRSRPAACVRCRSACPR